MRMRNSSASLNRSGDSSRATLAAIAAEAQHHPGSPYVAQRARAVLHVGLELVERVVKFAVALIGQRDESVENLRPPHRLGRLQHVVEAVHEIAIACERSQIHQSEQVLGIRRVEPIEIRELAHVMPDLKPQIP